jgi:flagellar motility protein MotE (MotC chaperone)
LTERTADSGVKISTGVLSFAFAIMLQIISLVWFSATQNAKIEDVIKDVVDIRGELDRSTQERKRIEDEARKERERILSESRGNDNVALNERRTLEQRITELEALLRVAKLKD